MLLNRKALLSGNLLRDPDARALVRRMSPKPGYVQQMAIQDLILDLKAMNLWRNLSNFYMLASHSLQAALLNWKGTANTLLVSGGTPAFDPLRGLPWRLPGAVYSEYVLPLQGGAGYWGGFGPIDSNSGLLFGAGGQSNSLKVYNPYRFSNSEQTTQSILVNGTTVTHSNPLPQQSVNEIFVNAVTQTSFSAITFNDRSTSQSGPNQSQTTGWTPGFGLNCIWDPSAKTGSAGAGASVARLRAFWTTVEHAPSIMAAFRAALSRYLKKIGAIL